MNSDKDLRILNSDVQHAVDLLVFNAMKYARLDELKRIPWSGANRDTRPVVTKHYIEQRKKEIQAQND